MTKLFQNMVGGKEPKSRPENQIPGTIGALIRATPAGHYMESSLAPKLGGRLIILQAKQVQGWKWEGTLILNKRLAGVEVGNPILKVSNTFYMEI